MGQWSVSLENIAAELEGRIDQAVRKIALDLFTRVVLRSPVDTGRFRANWNISYGSPDYSTSSSTQAARGTSEARKALDLPVGGVVFLSNGLAYGPVLEYGSSKQAPQGMVRLSLQELRRLTSNKAFEINERGPLE